MKHFNKQRCHISRNSYHCDLVSIFAGNDEWGDVLYWERQRTNQ